MQDWIKTTTLTLAAGAMLSLPAQAQSDIEQRLATRCGEQLQLGTAECACVVDRARIELEPAEVEYAVVRIEENWPEVERQRQILPLGQRLGILFRLIRIVDNCAAGAPYVNPL